MLTHVLEGLGGLGLFLLGILVLTEGLRALAGDSVQRVLARFTKSPSSGALVGAGLTAMLQSSSVTTVTTVGFVSAGLLTFSQALGVLFGANIGTTATGWLVALFGFELSIGSAALPLLFVGVLLKLFGKRKLSSAGWALAGFAVIFLGIATMQAGMSGLEGSLTPGDFPADGFSGRLLLVGIGALVTVVTQSSSAGVATALTAVDGGVISFAQAAAMVIGMDVGTTSTTAFATLGGSASTRRTGYAHVVFNLFTGVMALALLDPYVHVLDSLVEGGPAAHATLALVGFHTTFNALGVVLVLPFSAAFARLMTRLVPERGPDLTAHLGSKPLADAHAAALSLSAAVRAMAAELLQGIVNALEPRSPAEVDGERLERVDRAVDEARRFADRVVATPERPEAYRLLLASLHALDHLDRLVDRCRHDGRIATLREDPALVELSARVRTRLEVAVAALTEVGQARAEAGLREVRGAVHEEHAPLRERLLVAAARRELKLDQAIERLDAARWLDRTTYHAWRIVLNLEGALEPAPIAEEHHPSHAEIERDPEP